MAHNLQKKTRTEDVKIQEDSMDFSTFLLKEPNLRGLQQAGYINPSPNCKLGQENTTKMYKVQAFFNLKNKMTKKDTGILMHGLRKYGKDSNESSEIKTSSSIRNNISSEKLKSILELVQKRKAPEVEEIIPVCTKRLRLFHPKYTVKKENTYKVQALFNVKNKMTKKDSYILMLGLKKYVKDLNESSQIKTSLTASSQKPATFNVLKQMPQCSETLGNPSQSPQSSEISSFCHPHSNVAYPSKESNQQASISQISPIQAFAMTSSSYQIPASAECVRPQPSQNRDPRINRRAASSTSSQPVSATSTKTVAGASTSGSVAPTFAPRKGSVACLTRCDYKTVGTGQGVMSDDDFITHVLQWNPSWFQVCTDGNLSPPICQKYPCLVTSYRQSDYYNIFIRILFYETWLNVYSRHMTPYNRFIRIEVDDQEQDENSHFYRVTCKMITHKDNVSEFPKRNDIILYRMQNEHETYQTLGNVMEVYKRSLTAEEAPINALKRNGWEKVKFVFICLEAVKYSSISSKNITEMQLLINVHLSLLQNRALYSISNDIVDLILNPLGNRSAIKSVYVERQFHNKYICNKVEKKLLTHGVKAILVEIPDAKTFKKTLLLDLAEHLTEAALGRRKQLIVICVKTIEVFNSLVQELINSELDIVLAVRNNLLRLPDKFLPYSIDVMIKNRNVVKDLYLEKQPITVTLISASQLNILQAYFLKRGTICIFDKAHMFTEVETAVPLTYNVKKIVLIGNASCNAPVDAKLKRFGYGKSLMRRLKFNSN